MSYTALSGVAKILQMRCFTLPATGEAIDLAPGDELDLPAHTPQGAIVGRRGVRCAEAHR